MTVQIKISREMQQGFPQTVETSLTNLADLTTVELKKLAPFANPSQYPNGYPGNPGDLVRSVRREGEGKASKIVAGVPYALRRDRENLLNPQTRFYADRSYANTLAGKTSRWWRADKSAFIK